MAVTALPPAGLKDRAYQSDWAHRLYPLRLGAAYARLRARRWRASDPLVHEHARLQMRFLVGCLDPPPDLDALARGYVFETLKRDELSWRPWRTMAFPVAGIETLQRLHGQGGVVLNFMHHGQFAGVTPSVARHGLPVHMATDPFFFDHDGEDRYSRNRRQHLRTVTGNGAQAFPARGSYDRMRDLLHAGDVVAIASDLPGRNEVGFLGRRVGAAGGAARLALDAQVPVVPITVRRSGRAQGYRIEEPVLPGGFSDHVDLLQEVLRRHEPAIAAWPAAVERPLRRFAPVAPEDVEAFGYEESRYHAMFRI